MKFNTKKADELFNPGVYVIVNTLKKRIYVGETGISFNQRFFYHCDDLFKRKHSNKFFLNDFNKCFREQGDTDFLEFRIIKSMPEATKEERLSLEKRVIELVKKRGYELYNFDKLNDYMHLCVPVVQLDLNTNEIIREFHSLRSAARACDSDNINTIRKTLAGDSQQAFGFAWKLGEKKC